MKNRLIYLAVLALLFTACERDHHDKNHQNDNTAKNVRDRNFETFTAGDQFENEADRSVTQKIRQDLMSDDSLSTNAKNIKIITRDGVVTIRGPVLNARERETIAERIKAATDVRSLNNQLEVTNVNDQ